MKSGYTALLLVLSMLTGLSFANIYYVNDDAPGDPGPFNRQLSDPAEDGSAQHPFDSIQEAIDAALDGDTIIVAPGRYLSRDPWEYDEISFKGKSIRLVSSSPTDFSVAEQTILCGVVVFDGTEDSNCLLQGFKIQNHGHGGILGNKTQATVSHCIISGNGPCGATVVMDVHGQLRNCLIVDNTTFHDCGVQPVVAGCPTILNCTIANNLSGVAITNEGLFPGDEITIHNSIIYGNQGPPLIQQWNHAMPMADLYIGFCLVDDRSISGRIWPPTIRYSDPHFVRLGRWEAQTELAVIPGNVNMTLIEGDYHLKSEGWRWSPQLVHRSHWDFDLVTSSAIGAGDQIDSLGEELERVPNDPEGLWGVNRAINLGAFGGTSQASLAPTRDEAPGVGAVDLRDYWPMAFRLINMGTYVWDRQWHIHNPQGNARRIRATGGSLPGGDRRPGNEYSVIFISNAPDWVTNVNYYYANRVLYITEDDVTTVAQPPSRVKARYPQFLVPGTMIEVPYDPFVVGTAEYRSVLVLRGTLENMIADTDFNASQFVMGPWPDVIALREYTEAGAPGQLIAMFARGLGPLMLAGQPVEYAVAGGREFTTSTRQIWPLE